MNNIKKTVIGIDLGTTNSCVFATSGSSVVCVPNAEGGNTTPSMVAYSKIDNHTERLVGNAAKRQAVLNPQYTYFEIKRLIGKSYAEVKRDEKVKMPYEIVEGQNGKACVKSQDGKLLTAEEVSAAILTHLKDVASNYLGKIVTDAVITVPAYFNDLQRQATKAAGEIAGLNVLRIINEPTAAALAYGLSTQKSGIVAVYDLGGGTFDISILDIKEGVFEVLATNGDTHLGGADFDAVIMQYVSDEFKRTSGIDLIAKKDPTILQRLKEAAENAKISLSSTEQHEVSLPFITADASGPKNLRVLLSRAKLQSLVESLINKTEGPCLQAMKDAKITKVDHVLLVGGMTRMPAITKKVQQIFGVAPSKDINPDEVVAKGALEQARILSGQGEQGVVLLDVTPLSLGLETLGGVFTKVIEKNASIPCKKSQVFSTAADNQPSVSIVIYQGERSMAVDNKKLGDFILSGITPAPRGVPQIEVTFDLDANGILNVSAIDKATQKENKITISGGGGLSKEEIKRMQEEAEKFSEQDKERAELVDLRNKSDSLIYSSEKAISEHKEKITASLVEELEGKITALRKALDANNAMAELKTTYESLSESAVKIHEEIYKAEQANSNNSSATDNPENKN